MEIGQLQKFVVGANPDIAEAHMEVALAGGIAFAPQQWSCSACNRIPGAFSRCAWPSQKWQGAHRGGHARL